MYKIGIDIGSTYTKYCVMDVGKNIVDLFTEKTPIQQKVYFENKYIELTNSYSGAVFTSCGYGKRNIKAVQTINELSALAKGSNYSSPTTHYVLDIGGQDTKIIRQEQGTLKEFYINDKCAAGSGMFLSHVCSLLNMDLESIILVPLSDLDINLSSVCAVFAQSEIVELIADNVDKDKIVSAVIRQILIQAKQLLSKISCNRLMISGGLTQIVEIKQYAEQIFDVECLIGENSRYLSAIGCALTEEKL